MPRWKSSSRREDFKVLVFWEQESFAPHYGSMGKAIHSRLGECFRQAIVEIRQQAGLNQRH